jgi:hypothetical protein
MTVLITLTLAGTDTGPFDLYSDVDGFVSAFETGVSKVALQAGYSSSLVPNGATVIRVKSTGVCTNFIDINVVTTTTTTTSTSSTTTTTTTTAPPPACTEYYNNTPGDLNDIGYTGCDGTPYNNVTVGSGQSICAQDGTVGGPDAGFLTILGSCT